MAKIEWDKPGDRIFESGVDRGVLYPKNSPGIPWNGLVNVTQSGDGGGSDPYYIDGYKFYNDSTPEEFSGTIEAFTYPKEFSILNGDHTNGTGLYYGQQDREEFNLSYRTNLGSDSETNLGYKIHLLYNVLAGPSSESYSTLNNTPDPLNFSWGITTRGVRVSGVRHTAELVIKSTEVNSSTLSLLEDILYGVPGKNPRMPELEEVIDLFGDWPYLEIIRDQSDGLSKLKHEGLHDLKGNYRKGLYKAPKETRLYETPIPGLFKLGE